MEAFNPASDKALNPSCHLYGKNKGLYQISRYVTLEI